MCGKCCSMVHWRKHPLYDKWLKSVFEAPPFIGMNAHGDCNHLKWINGIAECQIFDERPDVCRQFPSHPLAIETIPTCSYTFTEEV
jgi:Fe-S-cluster containining protein